MMKLSTNYFFTQTSAKNWKKEQMFQTYVLRIWRTLTVPDWIITPFDIEIENANIEFSVQDEPVEINVDLEA
ncbi:hypothetical protein T12_15498 [Trichinella patagoniensis]|uniref:Uncharacterized protein n=1 Tax=Trichinella patagoniensis TaxID=990121 RepID=A0A0V0ZV87_9BILA|nr:hypothetical protein T12_6144 [Trichinella patagoniensis]KRY16078.1 hypothetical protein T12_15498 [Trichinella patagoniensis]